MDETQVKYVKVRAIGMRWRNPILRKTKAAIASFDVFAVAERRFLARSQAENLKPNTQREERKVW